MPSSRKIPRVAVWIETSRGYARGLIRGVADYVREHGPWSIYFTPHGQHDPLPAWLRRWRGDGILARIESPQAARVLLGTKLPLIDLSCRLPEFRKPMFGIDNRPVAQMAFDHLRQRGLGHFGFYGLPRGVHVHIAFGEHCPPDRISQSQVPGGRLPSRDRLRSRGVSTSEPRDA